MRVSISFIFRHIVTPKRLKSEVQERADDFFLQQQYFRFLTQGCATGWRRAREKRRNADKEEEVEKDRKGVVKSEEK